MVTVINKMRHDLICNCSIKCITEDKIQKEGESEKKRVNRMRQERPISWFTWLRHLFCCMSSVVV